MYLLVYLRIILSCNWIWLLVGLPATPNRNTKNLALRVCVFQNMHDLVSSCCSFAEIGKEMYRDLSTQCRANSVWSFKFFFGNILVHVVIVVCLSPLRVMKLFQPCPKNIFPGTCTVWFFWKCQTSTPSSVPYGITAHVWTLCNLELRTALYSPRVDY